ncbi:MAG: MobA/MobL family protein [Lachnospiraceae bacterium]|nr:MobA/MobL family protein [Lachnospiraceae bacterium]
MARHSFIQETKLRRLSGRIDYISSHGRQEHLYAVFDTADKDFWRNLALENREDFRRSGTKGECIEARELYIALPETYVEMEPAVVLKEFTEEFKTKYGVECISALHHNKTMTNYHIHLIFSERRLLAEPEIKVASRSVFYDEAGKKVRTKKEITGEDGQIRPGCTVIKKGEVYEQHLFSKKDPRFKSEDFLPKVKHFYTDLINYHIDDPHKQLKVFDPDSVYLPTKKIGKNNPKAAEIKADNEIRQEWNRTADVALASGVPEEEILKVRKEQIGQTVKLSIKEKGWLPGLFRSIVHRAIDRLKDMIRNLTLPPKPEPKVDIREYDSMSKLYKKISYEAGIVSGFDYRIRDLERKLEQTKGIFKGNERKVIQDEISKAATERAKHEKRIGTVVRKAGYSNVQAFMKTFRKAEQLIHEYDQELKSWMKLSASEKGLGMNHMQPKKSVREELKKLTKDAKQKTVEKPRSHQLVR